MECCSTDCSTAEYAGGDDLDIELHSVFNDHRLFCHQWRPKDAIPRALMCICHGVVEHAYRYHDIAKLLAENGILVFANDHVGHGRSEGERVYIDDINSYVCDVIQHIMIMKGKHPGLPCLLMGHSMGGLISGHVAIQRQDLLQGLILSAAPSKVTNALAFNLLNTSIKFLAFLAPKKPLLPWNVSKVTSIRDEVAIFDKDPLIYHGNIRFSWAKAVLRSSKMLEETVHKVYLPTLIYHGTEDGIVPFLSSEFLFGAISSTDKTFEVINGDFHDVLHDHGRDHITKTIIEWVLSHLEK